MRLKNRAVFVSHTISCGVNTNAVGGGAVVASGAVDIVGGRESER